MKKATATTNDALFVFEVLCIGFVFRSPSQQGLI